jgi:hypothetical protein
VTHKVGSRNSSEQKLTARRVIAGGGLFHPTYPGSVTGNGKKAFFDFNPLPCRDFLIEMKTHPSRADVESKCLITLCGFGCKTEFKQGGIIDTDKSSILDKMS